MKFRWRVIYMSIIHIFAALITPTKYILQTFFIGHCSSLLSHYILKFISRFYYCFQLSTQILLLYFKSHEAFGVYWNSMFLWFFFQISTLLNLVDLASVSKTSSWNKKDIPEVDRKSVNEIQEVLAVVHQMCMECQRANHSINQYICCHSKNPRQLQRRRRESYQWTVLRIVNALITKSMSWVQWNRMPIVFVMHPSTFIYVRCKVVNLSDKEI